MPISNYPKGFANGINLRGLPILNTYPGKVFWVDSGAGSDGNKGTFDRPFSTLDYAVGRCAVNNGDIIIIKAGHAETVATAGAIALDVAGISVFGLGVGADRPTFTFSAVDATMTMSAASISLKGILVKPSIDSVVSPIVVSAADCTIDIEVQDASAAIECVNAILTTADADRLEVNLKYRGFIAGNACVNAIRLVGVDTARIHVDFYGVASTAVVEFHTTACHDIDISGKFYNDGTSLTKNVVDTVTGSTWSARGWDGNSNANFTGGDNSALASDDVPAVKAVVDTILLDTGTDGVVLAADAITAAKIADDALSEEHIDIDASMKMILGEVVNRGTAALPATTAGALFTVAGGRVLVTSIVGEVTTVIQTQANNTKLTANPTTGTSVDMCTVLDISADEVGCLYGITGTPADALVGTNAGLTVGLKSGLVLNAGTIDLDCAATNTGSVKWTLHYIPIDIGATVVAA